MKILKFYAEWCNPCKVLANNIDKFKESHPEIEFVSINVEEDEDLAEKYGIRNLPVLVKLDNGSEVSRNVGILTVPGLEKFILNK
jgi:thioredoxin 1